MGAFDAELPIRVPGSSQCEPQRSIGPKGGSAVALIIEGTFGGFKVGPVRRPDTAGRLDRLRGGAGGFSC